MRQDSGLEVGASGPRSGPSKSGQRFAHIVRELRNVDARLLHGIAIAHRDGVVFFDRLEVDGHTKRSTHFVVAAVTLTYIAGVLVEDAAEPQLLQQPNQLLPGSPCSYP